MIRFFHRFVAQRLQWQHFFVPPHEPNIPLGDATVAIKKKGNRPATANHCMQGLLLSDWTRPWKKTLQGAVIWVSRFADAKSAACECISCSVCSLFQRTHASVFRILLLFCLLCFWIGKEILCYAACGVVYFLIF
ncbi:hypothetical protein CEXT_180241 [Caerostris extrusa]|uniref:Uncharacterized protein n=1 Tax=Caerostris extrusa TaxID=172846 RepID=A0AAV4NRN3_CAEEX|nr:hypothetical protein CEXT_180241 [Caerostris extrusa]